MSAPSRKMTRKALAALLQTEVSDAQAVLPYQAADFSGQSPVLVVTSALSERTRLTKTTSAATFTFDIHTFVLYSDTDAGWSEEDAEDALDDLEAQIYATIAAHQRTDTWQALTLAGHTNAREPAQIGGAEYRHEIISVAVEVYQ